MYPFDEINFIKGRLMSAGHTAAVAESVTSGHLQAAFSLAENARQFYQGGLTAYNLGQKVRHLHIEPIHASSCDCVSDKVAILMAKEVARLFSADYGLGVTGYAASVPEKNVLQPFAYFAICRNGDVLRAQRMEISHDSGTLRGLEDVLRAVPDVSSAIVQTLTTQLWFTRVVLQTFAGLLNEL